MLHTPRYKSCKVANTVFNKDISSPKKRYQEIRKLKESLRKSFERELNMIVSIYGDSVGKNG